MPYTEFDLFEFLQKKNMRCVYSICPLAEQGLPLTLYTGEAGVLM